MIGFCLIVWSSILLAADNYPLGCTEDENRILLNWPFFTIPTGQKVMAEEVCNSKPSLQKGLIYKIKPINNAKIHKDETSIVLKKGKIDVKKFYPSEDLSLYPGISIDEREISKESQITIYLRQKKGDGLFLFVLRRDDRIFARQIILDGSHKCPIRVVLPVREFFEIPYIKGDLQRDIYKIEMYMLNFNEMEWEILGIEIE